MNSQTDTPRPPTPLTYDDLVQDLVWPKLLRAAAYGLAPSRLLIAFGMVAILVLLFRFGIWIEDAFGRPADLGFLRWPDTEDALWWSFIGLPFRFITNYPILTIVMFPIMLVVMIASYGAIARSVACEFAQGISLTASEALRFSFSRLPSLLGAVLGPIVLIWFCALIMVIGGAILFRFPGLDVVGGLLFGLALILSFVAVLTAFAFGLGKVMLLPAVVCEGTDAIDAIQRVYAYVFGRPLRLVLYWLILTVEGALAIGIVWLGLLNVVTLTGVATSAFSGSNARTMIHRAYLETLLPEAQVVELHGPAGGSKVLTREKLNEKLGTLQTDLIFNEAKLPEKERISRKKILATGVTTRDTLDQNFGQAISPTGRVSRLIIRIWLIIPIGLALAYLATYWTSAGVLMYLGIRRVNDAQDMHEIWMPGMIDGTMAQALADIEDLDEPK